MWQLTINWKNEYNDSYYETIVVITDESPYYYNKRVKKEILISIKWKYGGVVHSYKLTEEEVADYIESQK